MQRETDYPGKRFRRDAISALHDHVMTAWADGEAKAVHLSYRRGQESWQVDSFVEFLTEADGAESNSVCIRSKSATMWLHTHAYGSKMSVEGRDRTDIQAAFAVLEAYLDKADSVEIESTPKPRIFIGHGRSLLWRQLKDHLHDLHDVDVIAYEIGSRSGHSIRDILDEMLDASSMAFLVMTAEDELMDGTSQPRANVIHEAGLFQGRLGFPRGIAVVQEGTKLFSNIDGIQQIRFEEMHINQTFGYVLAAIRREFPNALA